MRLLLWLLCRSLFPFLAIVVFIVFGDYFVDVLGQKYPAQRVFLESVMLLGTALVCGILLLMFRDSARKGRTL